VDALEYVGTECYIIHYEDWITNPTSTLAGLEDHLSRYGVVLEKISDPSSVIDIGADRSVYDDFSITNVFVRELNDFLSKCHGDKFNRP
ncbi:hypothetical protein, partial [Limnospira sp. PMC 917.15]|uniref:hypothetical protein n=1 Tax=Limnospira sp. PMC 917.15 TaxID=2981106 RepID=UPI0028E18195